MTTRLQALLLVSTLCLQLSACGNDDKKRTVAPYDSGVAASDKNTSVSDLSNDEKRQICEAYGRHVDAYVNLDQILDVVCLPLAILASGGTREGCEQELANCRAGRVSPLNVQGSVSTTDTCLERIDGCHQSVADFEGCVNVNLGAVVDILDRLTCAGAASQEQQDEARHYMSASVCSNSFGSCGDYVEVY